jgi:RNA polymerase sigma factor (sigma-70 family)
VFVSRLSKSNETKDRGWVQVQRRDRAIVTACLSGDEAAWTDLWRHYGPLVKATARRSGCCDDDVSEVLQRTALVALQGLERLRQPEKVAGWLVGIARFQVIELYRSRRPTTEVVEGLLTTGEDTEQALVRDQEVARLYSALTGLDTRCRTIITRLELHDPPATYQEVAEEVGLAPTSIGPIRRRCLQRLRKLYEVSHK